MIDGIGTSSLFDHPHGIALDTAGNVFVADTFNHRIRKIDPDGVVSTFAGTGAAGTTDGNRLTARFSSPVGVAIDSSGNLFVADRDNHRIRRVGTDDNVTTIAGSSAGFIDGVGPDPDATADPGAARFRSPTGVAVDAEGSLVVADQGNHAIRKVAKPIDPADPWEVT
ncbi:MAG: hypothetical protein GWO24_04730, partial [Akkermansiaceae bacterium]|nr:hypothetical protein [Akkermansiaceae bacterium]